MWRKGNPHALLVGMQTGAATVESSMEFPQKTELPFDPVISLLGINHTKPEILIQKHICTSTFIAVLFTIGKIWEQPECPLVGDWIKKLWSIHTME